MHTDEYEISLLKEVAVCGGYIVSLQNKLHQLEKKYHLTSDEVVQGNGRTASPLDDHDRTQWIDTYHALISWKKRKAEYEELHLQMKK